VECSDGPASILGTLHIIPFYCSSAICECGKCCMSNDDAIGAEV
jgi:hypothetical protein